EEVRGVETARRLRLQRREQARVRMTERVDADPRDEVQIAPARDIPEPAARTPLDRDGQSPVGLNHEACLACAYLGVRLALDGTHDGRRHVITSLMALFDRS